VNRAVGIAGCVLVMLMLHLVSHQWWWVMAVPLIYGVLHARSGWDGFLVGTTSAGVVWGAGILAAYLRGGEIVARRVAEMFMVGNAWNLIAATVAVAMLAAGLSAATGYHLRRPGERTGRERPGAKS
jgi:hypothetical protein